MWRLSRCLAAARSVKKCSNRASDVQKEGFQTGAMDRVCLASVLVFLGVRRALRGGLVSKRVQGWLTSPGKPLRLGHPIVSMVS